MQHRSLACLLAALAAGGCTRGDKAATATTTGALTTGAFAIRLPAGVYPTQVVFAANGSLKIADDVRLLEPDQTKASAANAGAVSTELGVQAQIKDLWSVAGVFLRNQSHVFCSVNTTAGLSQQSGVVIDGAINQGVDLGVRTAAAWNVTFPNPQRNIALEPGQSTNVTPGGYGTLSAKTGSTVTLTAPGNYYFQSLFFEPQARLVVQNGSGPVYVFVSGGTFTWRGTVQKQSANQHNVLFGFLGTADAVIDAPFTGTLVAPNAKTNLISTSVGYVGSFFAKSIDTAQPHVTYTHRSFDPGACAPGSNACAIGLGCPDANGNDKPDCQECPSGTPPPNPAPNPGFSWPVADTTAAHVVGIASEGDRFRLAPLIGRTVGAPITFPARTAPVLQVAAADLDDSGFADLAFLEGECTALRWIRRVNAAPARYDIDHAINANLSASLRFSRFLAAGDLDGDGFDDLLVTTTPRGVLQSFDFLTLTNNGNGTQFASASVATDYANATVVDQSLADFDSDGRPDLAASVRRNSGCGDTVELFGNAPQPGGPFAAHATRSVDLLTLIARRSRVDAMTAGDFDGDCKPDLWILAGGDLLFLKGLGDLTFAAPTVVAQITDARSGVDLDHLDVDSDGKQDLLVATGGGTLRWLKGSGTGSLTAGGGSVSWGRKVSVWQRGCVL